MIQEAYVSYETSLLLDEKGFEEETTPILTNCDAHCEWQKDWIAWLEKQGE